MSPGGSPEPDGKPSKCPGANPRLGAQSAVDRDVNDDRQGPFTVGLDKTAVDLMRRRGAEEKTREQFGAEQVSPLAPAREADDQAFRAALNSALAELPPHQRAVVHLKLWEGLTFEQIAGAMDIPLNTTASRYRYGLDKLRERLRALYEEIT